MIKNIFSLILTISFAVISCNSNPSSSKNSEEQAGGVLQESGSSFAPPSNTSVDFSKLRRLSFKETYDYGIKNQGLVQFPVFDEKGNLIPPDEISNHFTSNQGMIMYADEKGDVKAGYIRMLTEAEINEILQITQGVRSPSSNSN